MTVCFITFGCKVNQVETASMARLLEQQGVAVHYDADADADVYVVNSCTVTAQSDKKSRQALRRLQRAHPGAHVALCGCLPQSAPESVRDLPGVAYIGGNGDRASFVSGLLALGEAKPPDAPARTPGFERLPAGRVEERARAYLKIQDGCDNFCAYCVIPLARGTPRSLPLTEAVQDAQSLCREGIYEIVLTGIEISSWGRDLPGHPTLSELITAVCNAVGCDAKGPVPRIRLGSLSPALVTPSFVRAIEGLPNLCPHFHLSLQSGSAEVLARMGRRYTPDDALASLSALRQAFDGCAITADIIAGFPGETAAQHEETLRFLQQAKPSRLHVFPYSRRPGTAAAGFPGQLSAQDKAHRAAEITALGKQLAHTFARENIGQTHSVLVESAQDGCITGHTPHYLEVCASGTAAVGSLVPVTIERLSGDTVWGTVNR